jgi:hypothetical protein
MIATLKSLFTPHHTNNHRPRILHLEGMGIMVALLVISQVVVRSISGGSALPSILGFSTSITASQVVEQTNQQRSALGLPALSMNGQLNNAALAKGNNMCAEQYWAHVSPGGTTPWVFIRNAGYRYSVAGENLARDFSDTGSMVSAWMASPTHRENIVNSKYKEIGVAIVDCMFQGSDTAIVVQMFGSQTVAVAKVPSTPKPATTIAKTTTTAVKQTPKPTAPATASPSAQVEGEQSVPVLLANADPNLKLDSAKIPISTPYFSPLQVLKAIMVSILCILVIVLFVDMWIAHQRQTVRLVGKNLAHIVFLAGILLVVILIKAGRIF